MDRTETGYFHKHIVSIIRDAPDGGIMLPGGVHRGVGPPKVSYPFLVMAYIEGNDVLRFSGGYAGSGLRYLLKIVDKSGSENRAQGVLVWLDELIRENNGSGVSGAAVWIDRVGLYNLPVVEDDTLFQQVGRYYSAFVDPIGE